MIDTILNTQGMTGDSEDLLNTDLNDETDVYSSDASLSTSESVFSDSLCQQDSALENSLNIDQSSMPFESQIGDISSSDNSEVQDFYESQNSVDINNNLGNTISPQEVGFVATLPVSTNEAIIHQLDSMTDIHQSTIDIDSFVNVPTTDHLEVSHEDIEALRERVEGMGREEHKGEVSFGKKMCPTRHGCQSATDCDYCGGDYPG